MKIERWEEETDEDYAERLAEEIAIADNAETTKYFFKTGYEEDEIILNYVGEDGWAWREHPEGPFKATQIIGWKNKAEKMTVLLDKTEKENCDLLYKMLTAQQKLEAIKPFILECKDELVKETILIILEHQSFDTNSEGVLMGGSWSVHCLNYNCEKWANPCMFTEGTVAENCTDPKKMIGLTELPA